MTAPVVVSSLVLHTSELARSADFYRTVGVPLEHEVHDDGPEHFAAELEDPDGRAVEVIERGHCPSDGTT